jgi:hypothetical protein
MDERLALWLARAIRPHLRDLLGDQADDVDGDLARLLERSEKGRAVKPDVLRVIDRHEATREWADRLLAVGYGDLAVPETGPVQYIPPSRWVCPRFAECGTEFLRYSAGELVPPCPVHAIDLVQDAA